MSIQVLTDVVFPDEVVAMGARGKTLRRNERTVNQGGYMQITRIWTRSAREYEFGVVAMPLSDWHQIEALHEITDGGACGMLLVDPKDSMVSASQGLLYPIVAGALGGTIGFGYGVPTYRLHKRYTANGTTRTFDRMITRPKSPAALTRGGSPVTIGASAGNAAINYDTGTVTFVADSSQSIQSITVGASTVLNFSNGTGVVDDFVVGQRVYITGVSGTAASTLNSLSHAISAIGATSITISTSTSGLTATGGTALKYPQATEALAWSGTFYVPVHFRDDFIDWDLVRGGPEEGTRLFAGPSVVLQEIKER
jgi:uncharacterized protein (TIGR02217 family)